MLLQTIKSRNLWLWGETVQPTSSIPTVDGLKAEIQNLEHSKNQKINEFKVYSSSHEDPDNTTIQYQKDIADIDAKIKKLEANLKELKAHSALVYTKSDTKVNNVAYSRSYTSPFKITALQDINITWDNSVGESYGIKANFLQAWHNKPVNITFQGISYFGSFGGKTVGELTNGQNADNTNALSRLLASTNTLNIGGAISGLASTVASAEKKVSGTDGKYDTVIDYDIYKINKLLSLYGEGMYTSYGSDVASSWIHLLIENEPTESGSSFSTFVGHIKNFTYKENVSKPFLYDFTCQFVGEPAITTKIGEANITATQDKNSLKLSLVTSDSGFSLGYGF